MEGEAVIVEIVSIAGSILTTWLADRLRTRRDDEDQ